MGREQNKIICQENTKQNIKKKIKCNNWTDLNEALSP